MAKESIAIIGGGSAALMFAWHKAKRYSEQWLKLAKILAKWPSIWK